MKYTYQYSFVRYFMLFSLLPLFPISSSFRSMSQMRDRMISENEIFSIDNLFMIPFCSHCSATHYESAAYMHYFITIIFHQNVYCIFCFVCALCSFTIHDLNFIWMDFPIDFLPTLSSIQHHLSNVCCAVNENAVLP